ncbi:unnamed protein product [Ceratitis capitata]|uniref:(Mediterranean fruit fly) hypothetical protein n=1 Tax=Ceratitis capitata TaxID=7213 RepID=A0A811U6U0_CERCA|nr:unnamed protein product [Ceratitis capitata]
MSLHKQAPLTQSSVPFTHLRMRATINNTLPPANFSNASTPPSYTSDALNCSTKTLCHRKYGEPPKPRCSTNRPSA